MLRRTIATIAVLCQFAALAETNAAAKEKNAGNDETAVAKKESDGGRESDSSTKKPKAAAEKGVEVKVSAEKRRRLPRFFGKLQLDEDQKLQVYAIQGQYDQQLSELQAQIASLKVERDTQLRGVLTSSQKRKLSSLEKPKPKKTLKTSKSRKVGKRKS